MSESMIKSSGRTLELFELFAKEQRPLTIKAIAENMEMPQSSTSVLVKSLREMGYIEKSENDRGYYPTLRIALLGSWMQRQHQRAGRLPKLLYDISQHTEESTILARRNGIYTQYVLVQNSTTPGSAYLQSHQLYPLTCSSAGWCLLSKEKDNEIEKIIRRTQVEVENDYWKSTAPAALEHIQETRRLGYGFSKGETVRGLGAISKSLPSVPGGHGLVAGVGGPIARLEEKKDLILESLTKLSQSILQLQATPEVVALGAEPVV